MGEVSREADRRPQRRSRLPHPDLALAQTTTFKKKEIFFGFFWPSGLQNGPRERPGRRPDDCARRRSDAAGTVQTLRVRPRGGGVLADYWVLHSDSLRSGFVPGAGASQ